MANRRRGPCVAPASSAPSARHRPAAEVAREVVFAHEAVGVERHVDRDGAGVIGKRGIGASTMERAVQRRCAARTPQATPCRRRGASACAKAGSFSALDSALKSMSKTMRRRAERQQPVDEFAMQLARPGPDADLVEALGVDLDGRDAAADRPLGEGEALVGEEPVERRERAERERPRRPASPSRDCARKPPPASPPAAAARTGTSRGARGHAAVAAPNRAPLPVAVTGAVAVAAVSVARPVAVAVAVSGRCRWPCARCRSRSPLPLPLPFAVGPLPLPSPFARCRCRSRPFAVDLARPVAVAVPSPLPGPLPVPTLPAPVPEARLRSRLAWPAGLPWPPERPPRRRRALAERPTSRAAARPAAGGSADEAAEADQRRKPPTKPQPTRQLSKRRPKP